MESDIISLLSKQYMQELTGVQNAALNMQTSLFFYPGNTRQNTNNFKHYEEVLKNLAKLIDEYKELCSKDTKNILAAATNIEEYERKLQAALLK